MTLYEYYIIFPEGEMRSVSQPLNISSLFDINGSPLEQPLSSHKIIAYQICRKHTREVQGIVQTYYQFEQLSADELKGYLI